jgi:hypothetical protein
MAIENFEVPTGDIDGVNTVFTVSKPYTAGSLAVWVNLLRIEANDDGWTETTTTTFTMKEAPRSGDTLLVRYEES